jgi:hypothetical protein
MKQPSTGWRERIAPDEEAHFARTARIIGELQKRRSAKYGPGRGLHRKQLLATTATLDVLDGLPMHARHGLFATPGRHRALVRLSNGGPEIQANKIPDIRGFALKVFDVSGPGAMGGTADHQDFLMINQDRMPTPDSREFVDFIEASIPGPLPAERFNTVVPVACGPYAVRVRLKPVGNPPPTARSKDIAEDMRERLAVGSVAYDLELQFFVDEATTPIEDATKVWPDSEAPVVTVARLTLGLDDSVAEPAGKAKFDPWSGLADHRPLGEIMRARKAAYFASQQGRAA